MNRINTDRGFDPSVSSVEKRMVSKCLSKENNYSLDEKLRDFGKSVSGLIKRIYLYGRQSVVYAVRQL